MRSQCRLFPRVLGVIVVLASLALIGCGDEPAAEGDAPGDAAAKNSPKNTAKGSSSRYFADNVIEAWEQAGAKASWVRGDDAGDLWFREGTKAGYGVGPNLADDLPAFRIERWQEGVMATLPVPAVAFALDLRSTNVTDEGLKELAGLKSLQSLNLDSTRVGDAGVKALAGLANLKTLNLQRTNVTEAGVKDLAALKSLRAVNLNGVRASGSVLFQLRNALPDCTIYRRN